MKEVLLKDYRPECLLKVESHVPERARFPVIDAHNHLFGDLLSLGVPERTIESVCYIFSDLIFVISGLPADLPLPDRSCEHHDA